MGPCPLMLVPAISRTDMKSLYSRAGGKGILRRPRASNNSDSRALPTLGLCFTYH
jgi:hypothetical protein